MEYSKAPVCHGEVVFVESISIHIHVLIDVHLVGGFNPSEKYMSNTGENKNI